MIRFIARRILETIPVLVAVATLTFFMLRMAPGGPFDSEKVVSQEVLEQLEAQYGLDKPLWRQYLRNMANLAQLDLGSSFKYPNRTVNQVISEAFPVSMELGIYSLIIALTLGVSAGVLASLRPNSALDYIASTSSMVGICLPTFVLGPLLILVFALKLRWVNATGWALPSDKILPSLTLGLFYAAYFARLTRGGMLETLSQDYIRTARSKGVKESQVILKHALRGGVIPAISFLGPALARLIAGSFVIETVFGIPGLGQHFITSAFNRDYTMVMGVVLFYAALIVVFNMVVDILLALLNPRLQFEKA